MAREFEALLIACSIEVAGNKDFPIARGVKEKRESKPMREVKGEFKTDFAIETPLGPGVFDPKNNKVKVRTPFGDAVLKKTEDGTYFVEKGGLGGVKNEKGLVFTYTKEDQSGTLEVEEVEGVLKVVWVKEGGEREVLETAPKF